MGMMRAGRARSIRRRGTVLTIAGGGESLGTRRSFGTLAVTLVALIVSAQAPTESVARAADPSAEPSPASSPSGPPPVFAALPSVVVPPDSQLAGDASLVPQPLPPLQAIDVGAAWMRSQALTANLPNQDWQPVALADALQDDPIKAFEWVRDSIGFDPYAGELRGPLGALAARAGNSIDRALLLKKLLDLMAVPNRLVRGTLDDQTAAALVGRSFQAPVKALSTVPLDELETGSFDSIVTRARRDYALLRGALGDRVASMDGSANQEAIAATKDHVWVQMAFGAQWLDLDTSMPDAQPGQVLAKVQQVLDTVPDNLMQTVSLRVVAEVLSGGQLSESTVLEQKVVAADANGEIIYLTFVPAVNGTGGTIAQALGSATSWEPVLYLGADQVTGTPFPVTAGTDLFGGGPQNGPQVSRLRLEVTVSSPGSAPVTRNELLLDRLPAALRGSTTVIDPAQLTPWTMVQNAPAGLISLFHIQISTGGLDARSHQLVRSLAAQLTRTEVTQPDVAGELTFPLSALPAVIDDEELPLASEELIREGFSADPDVHAYVAHPRVFVNAGGALQSGSGTWLLTDLLSDGVSVETKGGGPSDAAAQQIWYGALETALETQLTALRAQKLFKKSTETPVGASDAMSQRLSVVGAGDARSLPPSASPKLAQAVADGQIAIVPGDPASARAWWTIDPATGSTRSVIDPGYGGQLITGVPDLGLRAALDGHGGVDAEPPEDPSPRLANDAFEGERAWTSEEMQAAADRLGRADEVREAADAAARAEATNGECGGEYSFLLCAIILGGEAVFFGFIGYLVYLAV